MYLLWSGLKLLLLESMAILASYKISNYKRVGQSILDSIFLDCLKIIGLDCLYQEIFIKPYYKKGLSIYSFVIQSIFI